MSHQTYTSFLRFQADNESNKILLATIEYSRVMSGWSISSGSVYALQSATNIYTNDSTIVGLTQSLTTLTSRSSVGALAGSNEFTFDRSDGQMYVRVSVDPTNNIFIFTRRHHVATDPYTGRDVPNTLTGGMIYYEPRLTGVSAFKQDRGEPFKSININSRGNISLLKSDGFYDKLLSDAFFENNEIRIYSTSKQLPLGSVGVQFLGNGKIFDINADDNLINFGFEDLFELINKIPLPLPSRRFRTPGNIVNPQNIGDYEPISKSKNPRYLYGRIYNYMPYNVHYLNENPTGGAASPLLNRRWNVADHYIKNVRSSVSSVISTTIFVVPSTESTAFSIGAVINCPNLGATTTAYSTISVIGAGGTITVGTDFTSGMAAGHVIIQAGIQDLFLTGRLVTPGLFTVSENNNGAPLDTTTLSTCIVLSSVQNSPETRMNLTIFQPEKDSIYCGLAYGKPSITTLSANTETAYTSTGDLLEFPGEIILDLLTNVVSITSDQINTTSFLSADAIRSIDIGFAIPRQRNDSTEKLIDIMQNIQVSALGQFRIGRTGRLEYYVWDSVTANQSVLTTVTTPLTDNDFLDYKESIDIKNLNQRIRLFYRYSEIGNSYYQIERINTQSSYLFGNSEKIKEIRTYIYSSQAAESISALYSTLYRNPWKIIKCRVKMQAADLFIGDRIVIEKPKRIQDLYRGSWTSIGADTYLVADSDQRQRHGFWTETNGTLVDVGGTSVVGGINWQSLATVPYKTVDTATQELFEVLSISKDGENTDMVLTNFGGNLITTGV